MKAEEFVKNNINYNENITPEKVIQLIKEYSKHVVSNAVLMTLQTCDDPCTTPTMQGYIDKIYKEVTK
jgi:hypothetical protein